MTAHVVKLQKASKGNTFLMFLLCFRRFWEIYNIFINITTFLKKQERQQKVENMLRKADKIVLEFSSSICRLLFIAIFLECTRRRSIIEASKQTNCGSDMICDQTLLLGVKRARLGKNGFVVFVLGMKN